MLDLGMGFGAPRLWGRWPVYIGSRECGVGTRQVRPIKENEQGRCVAAPGQFKVDPGRRRCRQAGARCKPFQEFRA